MLFFRSFGLFVCLVSGSTLTAISHFCCVIASHRNTKCPSLADRFNYFTSQNSSSSDEAAADIWLTPCQETDASGDGGGYLGYDVPTTAAESGDLPDNALALNVYASLPAYASDLRTFVVWYRSKNVWSISIYRHRIRI